MERFVKGDIAIVPFPFSDLTQSKRRPALVLAELKGDDLVLCQITSQNIRNEYAVELREPDFETGTLHKQSNIRPDKLFTADRGIILYKAGRIRKQKVAQVIDNIIRILKR